MKRFLYYVVTVAILLSFGSCTRRLTDFTVISTKNVPIGNGTLASLQKGNTRVKGKDVSHMVLCIPFGYPNMKEAIDKAIESTPGAVGLADGVVKTSGWSCLLYGQNKYIVEGTPIFVSDNVDNHHGMNSVNNDVRNSQQLNNYSQPNGVGSETMILYHKVKDGETLVEIAKLYGVKIGEIIKWNNLSGGSISEGQTLTILVSE